MKKYLLSILTLSLLLCEASFTGGGMVSAANKVGDTFTYTGTNSCVFTCTITKEYTSSTNYGEAKIKVKTAPTAATSQTLPTTLNLTWSGDASKSYYDITAIEADGFLNQTLFTSISTSSKIKTIGARAFKDCTGLTSVTIGSPVTSIGVSAFEGCSALSSVLFSGTGVTTLAASLFKNCTSLTKIGSSAGIVNIHNNISTINTSAFENCTGITKLTIGTGVTTLDSAAFTGCSNISTVTWNATNCTSSYTTSANPFSASKSNITTFTFGTTVQKVPSYLCYQMSEIQSVTIPQSVTSMGAGVFLGCSKLTNVIWNAASCADFTKSSGSVPTYSTPFCVWTVSGSPSRAENITSITFGSNVTKIPAYLCFNCPKLKVVTWEAGSATIGTDAFGSCTNLKNIIWNKTDCADFASASATPFYSIRTQIESFTFKNSVTLIPAYLCDGMTNLKQVSLPSTVTTVGANAFNGCTGMEVFACAKTTAPTAAATSFNSVPCCLTVPADSWDSYKDAIGWSHFNNAGCSNAPSDIVRGVCGAQGKNLIWELNLTSGQLTISGIGEMANYANSTVNRAPWYDDYRLLITNVTIEEGATSIGEYAFYKCENATFSTLPKSLIKIGKEAFWYCYAINEINFAESSELTTIGKWAFDNCTTLVHITIPENVITFDSNNAFTGCNALTSVTWNAKNCPDFGSSTNGPFNSINTKIQSFEFGSAVEHIPAYLCSGMSNAALTSITISENVISINANAFYGCSSLTNIVWNAANCADFTSSTNPFNSIKSNIISFTFGNTVRHIPAYLCYSMNNAAFTSVTIPASVTSIGTQCFKDCNKLTNAIFEGTVNQWCGISFADYYANPVYIAKTLCIGGVTLEDAVISASSIGSYAFYNDLSLKTVEFSSSVTSSGKDAFSGCTNINSANYIGTINQWCGISFTNPNSNPISKSHNLKLNGVLQTTPTISTATIKAYVFYGNTALTSVTFEYSTRTFENDAFNGCTGLTKVNYRSTVNNWSTISFANCFANPVYYSKNLYINNNLLAAANISVENIGDFVFDRNEALTSITLTNTLSIGVSAFQDCSNLAGILTLPEELTTIGNSAFSKTAITKVEFTSPAAANLTTIGTSAFKSCTSLSEITLPSTLTGIGAGAFHSCTSLSSMMVLATTPPTCSTSTAPFYQVTKTIPVYVVSSEAKTAYQAATTWKDFTNYIVIGIGGQCGMNLYWLLNQTTKELSFYGTGNVMYDYDNNSNKAPWRSYSSYLRTVVIPSELQHIGNYAFYGCTSITKVNNVGGTSTQNSSIGDYAFYGCNAVTGKFVIQAGVVTIGKHAFDGCSGITTFDFYKFSSGDYSDKRQLTTIDDYAFNGCSAASFSGLWNDNTEYLTTIGEQAFANCSGMYMYKTTTIPASLTTIGKKTFLNCTGVYGITIPENVTVCGDEAFTGCSNLTRVVWNATNCTKYTSTSTYTSACNPFYNTTVSHNITSFTFGENVEVIPPYLCKDMDQVTSIVVPSGVSEVGAGAFQNMTGLTSITADPLSPPTAVNNSTFNGVDKNIPILMQPDAATADYIAANGWKEFFNFYVWGYCGADADKKNLKWVLTLKSSVSADVGKMEITGTGAMENYANATSQPWNSYKSSIIKTVVIDDGVTTLGNRAFQACTALTSVTFPSTFSSLGDYVFYGCSALLSLNLPEGITSTGASMCYNCTSLASVSLPSTLTTIGSNAFMNNALTSVTIPNSVTTIGSSVFKGCASLTTVTFAATPQLTAIQDNTFEGCSSLNNFTIPNSVTTIGKSAFKSCSSLTSITIPENVTTITCYSGSTTYTTFSGCSNLTSVIWNAANCASGFAKIGSSSGNNYACPFSGLGSQITSFTFGENVQSIPNYLCYNLSRITTIELPATLTSIGSESFAGCTGITSITSWAEEPPTVANANAWTDVPVNTPVTVWCPQTEEAYKEVAEWARFTGIWYHWYSDCGELVIAEDKSMTDAVTSGFRGDILVKAGVTFDMDDPTGLRLAINNLTLEPTARIELASDATYTVNNLVMQRAGDDSSDAVATAQIQGSLTAENLILDFSLDNTRWYALSLPQSVVASSVTMAGAALTPDVDYYAMYFDGASRAANGYSSEGSNWKWVTGGSLNAGQGYLIGLPDATTGMRTLRFTMSSPVFNETADKTVTVGRYASDKGDGNAGWNLIGNPYLQAYHNTTSTMTAGGSEILALMTFTNEGEHTLYSSQLVSEVVLQPFSAVFVQSPADGSLVFSASSARKEIRARHAQAEDFSVLHLTLSGNGSSDRTSLVVGDYGEGYTIGADMAKWLNSCYKTQAAPSLYTFKQGGKEAIHALSAENLHDIPVGYYATKAGTYSFAIADEADRFESIMLLDRLTGITTDLKQGGYEFAVDKGTTDSRFLLSAVMKEDEEEVPTSVNTAESKVVCLSEGLTLRLLNLPPSSLTVYDATGKVVANGKADVTAEISVPQSGMYLIYLREADKEEVLRCVVR